MGLRLFRGGDTSLEKISTLAHSAAIKGKKDMIVVWEPKKKKSYCQLFYVSVASVV
jgi:hypothetical protein